MLAQAQEREQAAAEKAAAAGAASGAPGRLGQHDVGGAAVAASAGEAWSGAADEWPRLAPWEREVHCLLGVLAKRGLASVDEMRRAIETLPAAVYDKSRYYGRWARALLAVALERGALSDADVTQYVLGGSVAQEEEAEADRLCVGDVVIVRDESFRCAFERPHLRTPGYVHGVAGVVEREVGKFRAPEALARHRAAPLRTLCRVRFLQRHLWPLYGGSKADAVEVEIYRPWLRRGSQADLDRHDAIALQAASQALSTGREHEHGHEHHDGHGHEHAHDHGHEHHEHHEHQAREAVEQRAVDLEGPPDADEEISRGLIRALIARGHFTSEDLARAIESAESKGSVRNGARIVARAWRDASFRAHLLSDASAALKAEFDLDAAQPHAPTKLVVVENNETTHNVIVCTLCSCYPTGLLGPSPWWYKIKEYRARVVREPRELLRDKFGTVIGDDVAIRVHDSSADCRYVSRRSISSSPVSGSHVACH